MIGHQMGIWDRDWYRDELRRREGLSPDGNHAKKQQKPKRQAETARKTVPAQSAWVWTVLLLVLMFALAALVTDMKERGVPFTVHGFRWWLSLWFGP
jgi:hypothetical protein